MTRFNMIRKYESEDYTFGLIFVPYAALKIERGITFFFDKDGIVHGVPKKKVKVYNDKADSNNYIYDDKYYCWPARDLVCITRGGWHIWRHIIGESIHTLKIGNTWDDFCDSVRNNLNAEYIGESTLVEYFKLKLVDYVPIKAIPCDQIDKCNTKGRGCSRSRGWLECEWVYLIGCIGGHIECFEVSKDKKYAQACITNEKITLRLSNSDFIDGYTPYAFEEQRSMYKYKSLINRQLFQYARIYFDKTLNYLAGNKDIRQIRISYADFYNAFNEINTLGAKLEIDYAPYIDEVAKALHESEVDIKADRIVTKVFTPEFSRTPDNTNKDTFDFVHCTVSVVALQGNVMGKIKECVHGIDKMVLNKISESKRFQRYGVPVNILRLSERVYRNSSHTIEYIFEIKGS